MAEARQFPTPAPRVERASTSEPLNLEERIALVWRLLPQLRSLDPTELRTLAANLRVLSNVAEARVARSAAAARHRTGCKPRE
jgi:hypothetical protein